MSLGTTPSAVAVESHTAGANHALQPGERWRPSLAGIVARSVVLLGLLAFVVAIPHLVPVEFQPVVARAAVFAIFGLSMNVLVGYAGQVSLGHSAFVGVGAFTAGNMVIQLGMPYIGALVIAGLTGAVAAIILGGVALRVRGLYLAVVTIAYAVFAEQTLFNIRSLTGGGGGLAVPRPAFATSTIVFIYVCYVVIALVWLFDWRLTSSKAGRAIRAVRDNERVAASWGINVTGYKLLAFIISGVIAGMAGALFASIEEVAVSVTFGLTLGITILLLTVVGGLASRPGVIQGGIVFATIGTFLEQGNSAWASCTTTWLGGFVQFVGPVPILGPRTIEFLLGAALFGGGAAVVAHTWSGRPHGVGGTSGRIGGSLLLLGAGAYLLVAAFSPGTFCLFQHLTALFEPLIGALLLILTLIFFPGGIAQQQEDLLRWLSFRRFHAHEHHAVGATSGGERG
ncbi:MAG: branched-chain amino acid ABC transporter permease [Nitriliruptorales bacterium]